MRLNLVNVYHIACNRFCDSRPENSKGNEGQMAYFTPGKDPTQLWEMHPISEPSIPGTKEKPGKEIPGTVRSIDTDKSTITVTVKDGDTSKDITLKVPTGFKVTTKKFINRKGCAAPKSQLVVVGALSFRYTK